ncbi:hypothetical protein CRUP_032322, partial [Coryphaenoides rupestris]
VCVCVYVSETPEVYLSVEEETVSLGHNVSLSCNVSGHPYPQLYWIKKLCGKIVDSTSGRVRVVDGVLTIQQVAPSDGGLYSCMAVSTTSNASRDVALYNPLAITSLSPYTFYTVRLAAMNAV